MGEGTLGTKGLGVRVPKCFVVARNEYRIATARIRKMRPYFPYLAIGLLGIYVAFIAPAFAGLLVGDFPTLLLSDSAVAMVQVTLFMVFIFFMIIPITNTLREEQTGQPEIFLAAPIKPSDALLGEYLGSMPFYSIFVTVVTAVFTAALYPLGLDVIQMAIVILIFIVTFLSAFWVGTVIAAVLRTKLGESVRGRDIGRALAMIIALPLVASFYAIQFGGLLEALAEPGTNSSVENALGMLPISWGAQIIVDFASHPGNITAVGFETLARFGGLIAFFVAVLWLGAKAASYAYSLEPTAFIASRAKPDGIFYRTIKYVGGGSFGTLLASVFKDYGRRLENISNITYIMGVLLLVNVFAVPMPSGPDDPPAGLILAQFMFTVLVVMVTGGVTVRGKELLFLHRKAPSGEARIIKAMLMKSWLMVVPIAGVMTTISTILSSQATLTTSLTNTVITMLIAAATVAFALGLFLLNPAFSEKSINLWLNVIIVQFISLFLFAVSAVALLGARAAPTGGMTYVLILQVVLNWIVGLAFLHLGRTSLSRIE